MPSHSLTSKLPGRTPAATGASSSRPNGRLLALRRRGRDSFPGRSRSSRVDAFAVAGWYTTNATVVLPGLYLPGQDAIRAWILRRGGPGLARGARPAKAIDANRGLGRGTALLRGAADPGGEQVTQAHDAVDLAALHNGQMAEAVQQHDPGRVLDRCLGTRRLGILGHPGRHRDRGEVRPGRCGLEHVALGEDAGQEWSLHDQSRTYLLPYHRGGGLRYRAVRA